MFGAAAKGRNGEAGLGKKRPRVLTARSAPFVLAPTVSSKFARFSYLWHGRRQRRWRRTCHVGFPTDPAAEFGA